MTILLQTVWSSIICLRKNEFKISLLVFSICFLRYIFHFLSLVNGSYSLFFFRVFGQVFFILIKCFYLENVNFHSSCSEGCSKWFNISSSSRVNRNQTEYWVLFLGFGFVRRRNFFLLKTFISRGILIGAEFLVHISSVNSLK